MKRLGILHTAPFLVDVFKKMLGRRYPELESFHVVDESLIQDARRHGGMVPGIVRRIAQQVALAHELVKLARAHSVRQGGTVRTAPFVPLQRGEELKRRVRHGADLPPSVDFLSETLLTFSP